MVLFVVLSLLIVVALSIKVFCVLTHTDSKSKVCLVGKTALITGGNSGIGYQIVLALMQRGCRVIIADKVEDPNLLDNIFKETHSRNVVFKYLDLSSFRSVRLFANDIITEEEKIDILVNNAGVGSHVPTLTEDGLELVMQVNYYSVFLLTHLLIGLLKKAKGRVIFTSSGLSYFHNRTLEQLKHGELNSLNNSDHYRNSKLYTIMISDIFADKLRKYEITSNTYHPGIVHTKIFKNSVQHERSVNTMWIMIKCLHWLALLIGKSAEEGAQTAIYLACANEVKDITGEFFFETKPTYKPRIVHNKKICQAVWASTEDFVKLETNEKL